MKKSTVAAGAGILLAVAFFSFGLRASNSQGSEMRSESNDSSDLNTIHSGSRLQIAVEGSSVNANTQAGRQEAVAANLYSLERLEALGRLDAWKAIDDLSARGRAGDVQAQETLLQVDYAAHPHLAGPVIMALGSIAKVTAHQEAIALELTHRISIELGRKEARESLGNAVILIEAVGEAGNPAPVRELCKILVKLEDPVLQDSIVRTFARLASPAAKPCLEQFRAEVEFDRTNRRSPEAREYALSNATQAIADVSH